MFFLACQLGRRELRAGQGQKERIGAEAGFAAGLEVLGYTAQGQFLMNAGLLDCLASLAPGSSEYFKAAAMVQKLVQPHEMGELFKVIALGKGLAEPLLGFQRGDRSHTL